MLRGVWSCLCVVAAVLRPDGARAGAFNRAPGEGLALYASGFTAFGRFVDGRGREVRQPQASKFESDVLVEYGLSEWLMALVKPGFVISRDAESLAPAMSAGATLGLQAQVWRRDDVAVALQASARFARGDTGPTGTGVERAGLELRALAGRSATLGTMRVYLEGQATYRLRRADGDELMFDAGLIAPLSDKTQMQAQILSRFQQPTPQRARQSALKASLSIIRRLNERWSVSLGLFTTVHVRNARHERGVTFGLQRRF